MKSHALKTLAAAAALVLLAPALLSAQPCRIIGGAQDEESRAIVSAFTPANGYVITGYTKSFPVAQTTKNALIVRVSRKGKPTKAVVTNGSGDEDAQSIVRTSDKCYAVAGWTSSNNVNGSTNFDFMLMKFKKSLKLLWGKAYHLPAPDLDHGAFTVIEVGPAHRYGYALTGECFVDGQYRIPFLRVDQDGNVMWFKYYWIPSYPWQNGFGIAEVTDPDAPDVAFALAGNCATSPSSAGCDAFVLRLNIVGTPLGVSVMKGEGDEVAKSVLWDNDPAARGIVVAGWTRSYGVGIPNANIWVAKLRATDGTPIWSNAYYFDAGADGEEQVFADRALIKTTLPELGGGYAVSGASSSQWPGTPTPPNFVTIKLNLDGTIGWDGQATIHPSTNQNNSEDRAFAMTETRKIPGLPHHGVGYAVVGLTYSFAPPPQLGGCNIHFVTLDANGDRNICSFKEPLYMTAFPWTTDNIQYSSLSLTTTDVTVVKCKPLSLDECQSSLKGFGGQSAKPFEMPQSGLLISPNPASDLARIHYTLARPGNVKCAVYDAVGSLVRVVGNGFHEAGQVTFDIATSNMNRGVYHVRVETEQGTATEKLIVK